MQKIVIDSSVIVKWTSGQDEEHTTVSDKILNDCETGKIQIFAPELAKYEVGNALWKKRLNFDQTKIGLGTMYAGQIEFVKLEKDSAFRTMEIANTSNVTYYDASFVALAENLKAILVTDNPKHQSKFKGIKTIPLGDYK